MTPDLLWLNSSGDMCLLHFLRAEYDQKGIDYKCSYPQPLG